MQQRINAIPEITKNLIIINVLMFLATSFTPWMSNNLSLYSFLSPNFKPYQIVTHMFMHGNFMHLAFNMYGLYMFGSIIERIFGPKKYLFYYLATGLGAAFLQSGVNYLEIQQAMQGFDAAAIQQITNEGAVAVLNNQNYTDPSWGNLNHLINGRMLGASGAIFGLLAAFGMVFPNQVIQLLFPPVALKAKYFVLLYGALELYLGMTGRGAGVAHFAHLGGAVFGALIIIFWRKQGERFP